MNDRTSPIAPEQIEHIILLIRGQRVMLDRDLAALYGVETKNLNKAVRRNPDRFPPDFMFQLTADEAVGLRFHIGTLKRGQHFKYLPQVFTQEGVAMLSSVLRSPRAIQVNIAVMRVFVRLRQALALHKELADKLAELERKIEGHDTDIRTLFKAIRELAAPPFEPPRKIGFHEDSMPYRIKRKSSPKEGHQQGFAAWELIVIVCCLFVLGLFLLPWPVVERTQSKMRQCHDNLKQIGLGFLIWANDNEEGRLPIWVSTNHGGTLEYKDTHEVSRLFQTLSNYIEYPKYLVCPADTQRTYAISYTNLQNSNLSYFINVGEELRNAFSYNGDFPIILAGDRNITGGIMSNHSMVITSNNPIQWTSAMHKNSGNVARIDGSVETWKTSGTNGWPSYIARRHFFNVAIP
jgi:hypothetical protein